MMCSKNGNPKPTVSKGPLRARLGRFEFGSLLSQSLLCSYRKNLEVVGRDACVLAYAALYDITNDMVCATGWGEESACQGDSGGPVVMKDPNGDHSKDVLVGVVSCGEVCNRPNRPGVYSRVSAALSWFLSMMPCEKALDQP